jgi:hypothetical protein
MRRALRQADWCDQLGSPFSAVLLRHVAEDLKEEGAAWSVLAGFETEDFLSALALRLLGALHRLVLMGSLPDLARHYPSAGGDGDAESAWPRFRDALEQHTDEVRAIVRRPCQTNEVGRSAALLGGFLEVVGRTRLPLRLLEIGASAGLNLRWDHYRYESASGAWGDPRSPVRFDGFFDVPPPMDREAKVAERRGCDLNPVDPTTEDGSLTLRSFIWPDQLERFRRLEGAIAVARRVPAVVERIGAAEFLERELATERPDVATVVYHSVFIQYVGAPERARIVNAIEHANVAYLRLEPGASGSATGFEIRLGGELLGTAQAHGTAVRWA